MKVVLPVSIALFLLIASCSKDGILTNNCKTCTDLDILVCLVHHGDTIKTGEVYLKYDVTNKPTEYDQSAKLILTDDGPVATFNKKKAGKYYIYANGYDERIGKDVSGGIPVTISSDYLASPYWVKIPVSEDGH